MIIKLELGRAKRQLETLNQRDYTWKEIATGVGVHYNTLYALASNTPTRLDLPILAGLIEYFAKEGLSLTIADLLKLEEGQYEKRKSARK